MKTRKTSLKCIMLIFLILPVFLMPKLSFALTPGEPYNVSVEAVQSNGILTSTLLGNSLGISTSAVADSNGKLEFTVSGVPNSDTYNFLAITVTLPDTGTVARRSVVPAPASGGTLNLGVSSVTNAQTNGFIAAFAAAGSDDPILALFGYLLVRSADVTATEIATMATFCYKGIKGTDGTGTTDGFEAYLRSSSRATPATAAMMAQFRQNIVTNLSAYSSLYKDAVDEYFTSGASGELSKRGEAAARLMEYLIDAAVDAGINPDDVLMAIQAMGVIVVPLMEQAVTDGTLRRNVRKSLDATISRSIDKLRADKFMNRYNNALTTLSATTAEIARYNAAATALLNTMISLFQTFEASVNGDDMPDDADDVDRAGSAMNVTMQAAFDTFMSSIQATDAEIIDLRDRLAAVLIGAGASESDKNMYIPTNMFKWYDSNGNQVNWPIMMVVTGRWLTTLISNGGTLSYTRDTLSIPDMMSGWMSTRRNYTKEWDGVTPITDPNRLMWGALQGIREDVEIIEFNRWGAFSGFDALDEAARMQQMQTIEELFYQRLDGLKSNISGTTDGMTNITNAEKGALITLYLSPDL
ncbi:MAG: hypothetical protein ABH952_10480 [Candidatus Omnitrophota bacterium]